MMNRAPYTQGTPSPLRLARLACLLTQQELARRVGISQSRLSVIERGYTVPRDDDEAWQIAKAVGRQPVDFWPGLDECASRLVANKGARAGSKTTTPG